MRSDRSLPIHSGDSGTGVFDLQRRLIDLGLLDHHKHGICDEQTTEAVRAFQSSRNLRVDGITGLETWGVLIEAGWRLGDRVLFERYPPWQRGDDVASLQEHLANLGFDVGKVDGIFGPFARRASIELQRNCGLVPDGVVGVDTIRTLHRVSTAPAGRPSLTLREELIRFGGGLSNRRIFLDPHGGAERPGPISAAGMAEADFSFALALSLAERIHTAAGITLISRDPDTAPEPSDRASLANWFGANVVIAIGMRTDPAAADADTLVASYYGTPHFVSSAGRAIAHAIGQRCDLDGAIDVLPPIPSSRPILRETRAVSVLLEFGVGLSQNTFEGIADPASPRLPNCIFAALDAYFRSPR